MESNGIKPIQDWIPVRPPFETDESIWSFFVCRARQLVDIIRVCTDASPATLKEDIFEFRRQALADTRAQTGTRYQLVRATLSILCDLALHGWALRVDGAQVSISRPSRSPDRQSEKERVRRALLLARDEQMMEPVVREFVRSMESRRPGPQGWTSIYALMRDGRELASKLETAAKLPPGDRGNNLSQIIAPYLQFVTESARCEWTGLRLADIWRYFRYTWLTPARSTPGRQMMILIRDAAVESHPVIGIAALSSSIVQQSERDRVIGWDGQSVLNQMQHDPSDDDAAWLLNSLVDIIDGIHTSDLATEAEIAEPTSEVVDRLAALGMAERARHKDTARDINYRSLQQREEWAILVNTPLYRSKRALALADMLSVRMTFQRAGLTDASRDELLRAASEAPFRAAVSRLVRSIKAAKVGIHMMDISVAGAVAPYNAILGGKLVSMLLTSPEVRLAYTERYGGMSSVIASAMKGAAVVRRPDLVLLCTTGLFGGSSSQYNRVRVPASALGSGQGEVRYTQLQEETMFATFHISAVSQKEMRIHGEQWHDGSDVNFIFGEGVNPKMRQIREGLARAGYPPEEILQAASPRVVYLIPLAHNYRDILLGRTDLPDYVLPLSGDGREDSSRIAGYWKNRWLLNRIQNPEVISTTRSHHKFYPISHGAAVQLPHLTDEDDGTGTLSFTFADENPDESAIIDGTEEAETVG